MMYFDKIVASLKCNGKFLRDKDGMIEIPFGSEYSLYLKNMESRDCVVKIEIDGKDVLSGNELVLRANSNMELEGFLEGNTVKKKFKFISLSKQIEDKIGVDPEFSTIRIEFRFKKEKPVEVTYTKKYEWEPWKYWLYSETDKALNPNPIITWRSTEYISPQQYSYYSANTNSISEMSCYGTDISSISQDNVGITIEGSDCKQDFSNTYVYDLEDNSHVMILRLSGYTEDNKKVETIVGTRDKKACLKCGKRVDQTDVFCRGCGNLLIE